MTTTKEETRGPTRTDITSRAIAVTAGMPSADSAAIIRCDRSVDDLNAAVEANHRSERQKAEEAVVPPATLGSEVEPEGYREALRRADRKRRKTAKSQHLADHLPTPARKLKAASRDAQQELPRAKAVVEERRTALRDERRRQEHARSQGPRAEPLIAERKSWVKKVRSALGAETFTGLATILAFFGVLEPGGDGAGLSVRSQATALVCAALIATWGSPSFAAWAIRHVKGPAFRRLAIGLALLVSITYAAGITLMRYSSSLTGDDDATGWGATALLCMVLATTLIVGAIIFAGELRIAQIDDELKVIHQVEDSFAEIVKRLTDELAAAELVVRLLEETVAAPDVADTAWESDLHRFAAITDAQDALLADHQGRARTAWDFLHSLSGPDREQATVAIFKLVPATEQSTAKNLFSTAGTALSIIAAVVFLGLSACSKAPPPPRFVAIICDGSGYDPAAVCTSQFVLDELGSLLASEETVSGSVIVGLAPSSGYGSTRTLFTITVPRFPSTNPRAARKAWTDQTLADAARRPLTLKSANPHKNVSNLPETWALAVRLHADHPETVAVADLVQASDGLLVTGDGSIDAERRIPSVVEVTAYLHKQGIELDLSGFRTVTLCGLHSKGITAAMAAARDRFFTGFVPAVGGPVPRLLTSCASLNPNTYVIRK